MFYNCDGGCRTLNIAYFKWVNCMIREYLNGAAKKKKPSPLVSSTFSLHLLTNFKIPTVLCSGSH